MKLSMQFAILASAWSTQMRVAETANVGTDTTIFSSAFVQPAPPKIQPEFKASWNQHKWNENVSHIASGYLYSSLSNKMVRVDEAYDMNIGSSLFDYNNQSAKGVSNIVWLLSPAINSQPTFFSGYVQNPGFPLLQSDLLVQSSAVYAGVSVDPDFGSLDTWNFLFGGSIPVSAFVDGNGVVHGYNFWDPNQRTYVITRLFNIVTGTIAKDVFDFPRP